MMFGRVFAAACVCGTHSQKWQPVVLPIEFRMKRLIPSSAAFTLVGLALLMTGVANARVESRGLRTEQHETVPAKNGANIQAQEPQVPFSALQSAQAALSESVRTINQQVVAAGKQAEAYKETWCSPAVIVQVVLAVIGAGYLLFAGLQWNAIKEQAGIAKNAMEVSKQSLLLQFRPKLTVRNVVIDPAVPVEVPDAIAPGVKARISIFRPGYPVKGQLYVANVGGTDAEITESGCWVEWIQATTLPMRRPYEGLDGNAQPFMKTLPPGTSTPVRFESRESVPSNLIVAMNIESGEGWGLYVLGWSSIEIISASSGGPLFAVGGIQRKNVSLQLKTTPITRVWSRTSPAWLKGGMIRRATLTRAIRDYPGFRANQETTRPRKRNGVRERCYPGTQE